jgi:hypothetical protein
MVALIPYVREMFRRHLSAKQAVMLVEFDKLKRVRGTPGRTEGRRADASCRTTRSTRTRSTRS